MSNTVYVIYSFNLMAHRSYITCRFWHSIESFVCACFLYSSKRTLYMRNDDGFFLFLVPHDVSFSFQKVMDMRLPSGIHNVVSNHSTTTSKITENMRQVFLGSTSPIILE